MNRTVKKATVKAFHDADMEGLDGSRSWVRIGCSFAKHLKALR
jgi:hypothetical protein